MYLMSMDSHLHLFIQVHSYSLQEKLVKIMQNLSLSALWIGGWYNSKAIISLKDTYHVFVLTVCLTLNKNCLCTIMHCQEN
mgnify:FL=1